jgi:hypothetical protein
MNLTKKLVSVAAGVALVAGVGLAAAPAQAAPKVTGKTDVSLRKNLPKAFFDALVPLKPAKYAKYQVSFPVTGADGEAVTHSGGVGFKTLAGTQLDITDPVMSVDPVAKTASIVFTTATFGPVEIFGAKNMKIVSEKKDKKKKTTTVVWQGNATLTSNPLLVDVLNGSLGVKLVPGQGVGTIRTTIITKG